MREGRSLFQTCLLFFSILVIVATPAAAADIEIYGTVRYKPYNYWWVWYSPVANQKVQIRKDSSRCVLGQACSAGPDLKGEAWTDANGFYYIRLPQPYGGTQQFEHDGNYFKVSVCFNNKCPEKPVGGPGAYPRNKEVNFKLK